MKRLGFVLGLVVLALIGCVVFAGATQQVDGILKVALTASPPTLDPYLAAATATRQIASYMFESLVTYDENYNIIPQIADRWEISDDRLTYTFHLRSDIKFHNGNTLTAADVAASFDRLLKVSVRKSAFADVESFSTPDPLTFQVVLKKPVLLLVQLAMPVPLFGIFPADIVKDHLDELRGPDELVGTGPYRLAEWKPGQHVKLVRFDDYVSDTSRPGSGLGGGKIAYSSEIYLLPVTEQGSRLAGLLTGAYDFAEGLPIAAYDSLISNPDTCAVVVKPKWGITFDLNKASPPMDNVKFRQALLVALDMGEIMATVASGNSDFYRVQPSVFFPEQAPWYTVAGSDGFYDQHNPERTRELLKEADYQGEEIIILSNRDYDWMYKCSLSVAAQLQRAGINAVIEFMDWPSQIERAGNEEGWHLFQTGWSPKFDPSQLNLNLRCGNWRNAYGYCNEEMEKLLDEILEYQPLIERQITWEGIQELMWKDVTHIHIGDYFTLEGIRSDIKGYKPWYVIPRFWNVWREN